MPKISVIMGVYNGAASLDNAIESICSQTYENWEMIICDDCSSDNTIEKLQKWSDQDSRIKIISNKMNVGLAATLNHCLRYTSGEYIARMDDDDISYPDRFKIQLDFLEKHPQYDFVSSIVDCFDGTEIVRNRFLRKEEPQKEDFLHGTQFVHPATVFRKSCLIKVGGYWEDKITRRTEDYDLFMRLYEAGCRGYNIQIPLLRYTVNVKGMKQKSLYRYRVDEAKVRYKGFLRLGLLPKGLPYVVRPLIVGLIPKRIIWRLFYKK